jgi:hypothetical protein
MAFDIGLKLTTLHLIVLGLVLVAPDARRLVRFFVENREVSRPLRESWRGSPAVRTAVIVFGVYLIGMQVWANVNFWYSDGGGAPRSAFYGIWDVEEITVSGVTRPAVLNDYDRRWRRLIFDDAGEMAIQRTDDSLARFAASIDEEAGTLELKRPASPANSSSSALVQYSPDEPGRLLVEGVMDGLPVRAVLRRRNEDTFRLLNSGFRWIRPDAD